MNEEECLPLGAQHQHQHHHDDNHAAAPQQDPEEEEHFHQVCQSYQQYATFHQTRQQGVNHRMMQVLAKDSTRTAALAKNNNGDGITDGTKRSTANAVGPTVESILPPTLHPQTPQHQQYTKQFCEATIRNQFFLDNILKYSDVATSQEVLRQRRAVAGNGNSNMMEWATEDQMSKIDSVLKSVARDWSAEMKEERSVVYDRLIGALEKYMPINNTAVNKNGETNGHDMDECTSSDSDLEQQQYDEPPRVAVPGSGLGRLAWEIYSRGYSCQGSDFSLPMLLASDFILNGCGIHSENNGQATAQTQNGGGKTFRQFAISPWISETKNMTSFQHRIRTVVVPDVDPTAFQFNNNQDYDDGKDGEECNSLAAPEFTMMAGEFLSLYSHFLPEHQHSHDDGNNNCSHPKPAIKFNAVVCSFFIDTASSLPHYLLTIYHMLEDGGLFINFGPLMYHWSGHGGLIPGDLDKNDNNTTKNQNNGAIISSMYQKRTKHLDSRYLSSVDYTWEEVRYMILQCGFEIVEEELGIPARYTSDGCSMMKVVYDCAFLVARKKPTK